MNWTKRKPKVPGAYYIRGWEFADPYKIALVEVRTGNTKTSLLCNLGSKNTEKFAARAKKVSRLSANFEWLGPLPTVAELEKTT